MVIEQYIFNIFLLNYQVFNKNFSVEVMTKCVITKNLKIHTNWFGCKATILIGNKKKNPRESAIL